MTYSQKTFYKFRNQVSSYSFMLLLSIIVSTILLGIIVQDCRYLPCLTFFFLFSLFYFILCFVISYKNGVTFISVSLSLFITHLPEPSNNFVLSSRLDDDVSYGIIFCPPPRSSGCIFFLFYSRLMNFFLNAISPLWCFNVFQR